MKLQATPGHFAAALALAALALAGCDKKPETPAVAVTAPAAPTAPSAPAGPATLSGSAAAPSASFGPGPTPPPAAAAAATAAPRTVPVSVQGATAGLTVRVKAIELGEDATVLTVNASFANQRTNYTKLATADTYLQDEAGNKLMLKRPADNQDLNIANGESMEGKLVFLGSVPASASQLKLVFNDGRAPDDLMGPGLTMTLPLAAAGT